MIKNIINSISRFMPLIIRSAFSALAILLIIFLNASNSFGRDITKNNLVRTIVFASRKYGIPLPFLVAVMRVESDFNVNALSPKGAEGLMQVMPETGRQLALNIHNPSSNIIAGAKYLRYCLKRFDFHPVPTLACYNAGPNSVKTVYIKNRPRFLIPAYRSTEIYILRVYKYYNYYRKLLK